MTLYSRQRDCAASSLFFSRLKVFLRWSLFYFFLSSLSFGWTQDEFIIIEEEPENELLIIDEEEKLDGVSNYWDQHFYGSIDASYSGIGDSSSLRWNSQFRLGFSEELGLAQFVLEARAYRSYVEFVLAETEGDRTVREFTGITDVDEVEILEGYTNIDLNRLLLSFGRKKVVFGQFDLFSPIDIVLPLDLSSTTISFSKVENRLPQNVASAQLFLPRGFEVHYYYFPNLLTDALTSQFNNAVQYEFNGTTRTSSYIDPADENQEAVRLLYVNPQITIGLTFFRGNNFFAQDFVSLIPGREGYLCQDGVYRERCGALDENNKRTGDYVHRPSPTLPSNNAVGVEVAIPAGRMTYKFEWSRNELQEDIWQVDTLNEHYQEYIGWVIEENDGKEYIDVIQHLYALGFDYYSARRLINFSFLLFEKEYDAHAQRGKDLAEQSGFDAGGNSFVIPIFHIAGNYGTNLDHRVGWVLGSVGFASGTSVYYQNTVIDSLLLWLSFDFLDYRNDSNIVDAIEEDEQRKQEDVSLEIERQQSMSAGLRLGISYKF